MCYPNCLLMVNKFQIYVNVKLNIGLYLLSILISLFIMFLIIELRNYRVPGKNKSQRFNNYKCQN